MPEAAARAHNALQIEMYAQHCYDVIARIESLTNYLHSQGRVINDPPVARAQIEPMKRISSGDGAPELDAIHSAWQQLKHPYLDALEREAAEAEETQARRERESHASTARAVANLKVTFQDYVATRIQTAASAPTAKHDRLLDAFIQETEAIAKAGGNVDDVRQHVFAGTEDAPLAHVLAALHAHRLTLESENSREHQRRIRERMEVDAREQRKREFAIHQKTIVVALELLPERFEAEVLQRLHNVQKHIDTTDGTAFDEEIAAIHELVRRERARTQMSSIVTKVLHRMGYEHAEPLQTIRPSDVNGKLTQLLYLRDSEDSDRFIEIALIDDAVSVEVVRGSAGNDSTQRQRDAAAQRRLCGAMKHVEAAAENHFDIKVRHEADPGAPAEVRSHLKELVRASKTSSTAKARTV